MIKHSLKVISAHDIASENYLDNLFSFTSYGVYWECLGYSKKGNSVKFSRLEKTEDFKLKQINRYVHPDRQVYVWKKEQ